MAKTQISINGAEKFEVDDYGCLGKIYGRHLWKDIWGKEMRHELDREIISGNCIESMKADYWLNMPRGCCYPNSFGVYNMFRDTKYDPKLIGLNLVIGYILIDPDNSNDMFCDHLWLATDNGKVIETWVDPKYDCIYIGANISAIETKNFENCLNIKDIMELNQRTWDKQRIGDPLEKMFEIYPSKELKSTFEEIIR